MASPGIDVLHLGIHEIDRLAPVRFDAAYSNFGPLNCVDDLGAAAGVWTRYYTAAGFARIFAAAGFTRLSLRSLGLFAYLEAFAGRHPRLVSALQRVDDRVGGCPGIRAWRDHFLIVLRKA